MPDKFAFYYFLQNFDQGYIFVINTAIPIFVNLNIPRYT